MQYGAINKNDIFDFFICFQVVIIAWMINEIKRPVLRAIMTLVFYAPTISGQAYFIWKFIFSSDSYGFANGWLMKLGATYSPILWFEDGKYIQPILIVVVLWMSMGTGFLSFIAGLQNVDRSTGLLISLIIQAIISAIKYPTGPVTTAKRKVFLTAVKNTSSAKNKLI